MRDLALRPIRRTNYFIASLKQAGTLSCDISFFLQLFFSSSDYRLNLVFDI